jgi:hypothetical protein
MLSAFASEVHHPPKAGTQLAIRRMIQASTLYASHMSTQAKMKPMHNWNGGITSFWLVAEGASSW